VCENNGYWVDRTRSKSQMLKLFTETVPGLFSVIKIDFLDLLGRCDKISDIGFGQLSNALKTMISLKVLSLSFQK